MIKEIVDAVTIPVMAKVRIGHFVEAQVGPCSMIRPALVEQCLTPQILQAIGIDYIDESEVLTPADETVSVKKRCIS